MAKCGGSLIVLVFDLWCMCMCLFFLVARCASCIYSTTRKSSSNDSCGVEPSLEVELRSFREEGHARCRGTTGSICAIFKGDTR